MVRSLLCIRDELSLVSNDVLSLSVTPNLEVSV